MCIQLIHFSGSAGAEALLLIALMSYLDAATVAMVTIRIDKGVHILCVLHIQGILARAQRQTLPTQLTCNVRTFKSGTEPFRKLTEMWRLNPDHHVSSWNSETVTQPRVVLLQHSLAHALDCQGLYNLTISWYNDK